MTFRNKENVVGEDLAALTPRLESLFQDHFSGNPITFSEAMAGNCLELSKLTLLLLYITLVTEAKLRSRLVNSDSLDQTTQAKVSEVFMVFRASWSGCIIFHVLFIEAGF
ncbi:hypothetical protein E2C01_033597 [Portunus trituberculatus]|uniref:Uncharacterized protein n=1 Tax=Portunus trituberculatus TaxID=210409 RepID=A0A5B7F5W6_PORTR|nr:hypothetical protein [Portunus trituberculatus]